MTREFVTLKSWEEDYLPLGQNTIEIPSDMTLLCKAKSDIREFSMFNNEKLALQKD
jgi:hypothetical protein